MNWLAFVAIVALIACVAIVAIALNSGFSVTLNGQELDLRVDEKNRGRRR